MGELLPRLSILTLAGGLFLLHFPGSRLRLTLSVTLPYEARTFLTVIPFGNIPRDRLIEFNTIISRFSHFVKKYKNLFYKCYIKSGAAYSRHDCTQLPFIRILFRLILFYNGQSADDKRRHSRYDDLGDHIKSVIKNRIYQCKSLAAEMLKYPSADSVKVLL